MNNFEWLASFDDNMEFDTFCSNHYNNNGDETSTFILAYSEPFNDNFANINLSLYSEPLNINLLLSSLELYELPSVLPIEPPLISDDNFADVLPLEPVFNDNNYQYNFTVGDSFDD